MLSDPQAIFTVVVSVVMFLAVLVFVAFIYQDLFKKIYDLEKLHYDHVKDLYKIIYEDKSEKIERIESIERYLKVGYYVGTDKKHVPLNKVGKK